MPWLILSILSFLGTLAYALLTLFADGMTDGTPNTNNVWPVLAVGGFITLMFFGFFWISK